MTTRRLLLSCGILSSLVYAMGDVAAGLAYPGYSFTSQAISELGAVGAPSGRMIDAFDVAYNALVIAFALALLGEAVESRRRRAVRISAGALLAYGALGLLVSLAGLTGITYFKMAQRGAGGWATDAPHIVLTGVLVLLLMVAISSGALVLGRRFRAYSIATLLTLLGMGALTSTYAARVAAGEPTPGMGIVERIDVYASMLWLAVFAAALLRRRRYTVATGADVVAGSLVNGFVAPGFEEVRREFERNFAERGEIGAAVAAYWRGEKVVDLWGGRRTPNGDAPWDEDTLVVVMSTTKGLSAMTLAIANARGWLDYDAPVARYWPEFAQNGKAGVTVRQLLGHEAGLVLIDEPLTVAKLRDLDGLAAIIARQTPAWPPGTRHGYHTMTIGLYMQELIRRVDPAHRTLGRFFREEIAERLGLEFYIGLPADVPDTRLAKVKPMSRLRALLALPSTPPVLVKQLLRPHSLLRRSMVILDLDMNERPSLEIELPSGNGVGTARAIARAYSALAEGGAELGITAATMARLTEPPAPGRVRDEVIGVPSYFSLGFLRPGPEVAFGSSPRAFGAPGAGGSFAFADPDARLGFAYVMNKLDFHLTDDPREKSLRDAIYRAIRRVGGAVAAPEEDVEVARTR